MKSIIGVVHAEAVGRGDSEVVFSLLLEAIDVVGTTKHALAATFLVQDWCLVDALVRREIVGH